MNTHTGTGDRKEVTTVTTDERTTPDQRHLPDNVVRFDRTERRAKPRWMERMDAQGLPVQDSTSRIFSDGFGGRAA
jgi:hypothetical protein